MKDSTKADVYFWLIVALLIMCTPFLIWISIEIQVWALCKFGDLCK